MLNVEARDTQTEKERIRRTRAQICRHEAELMVASRRQSRLQCETWVTRERQFQNAESIAVRCDDAPRPMSMGYIEYRRSRLVSI